MKVRIALTPPADVLSDPTVFLGYLHAAEEHGFDTIWLSDVPLGPLGDPTISLAFAAAATTKLKLGLNLVPLGRNPFWVAKQLAQIDRLSGGRLLISLVPGLGSPQERALLGHQHGNRGAVIDEIIGLLRAWWSGEEVTGSLEGFRYERVRLQPTPTQEPLELWLGGIGPAALDRVARLADGWLTANASPAEAAAGRRVIERTATEIGRVVDGEHFGISIPFCVGDPAPAALEAIAARRGSPDVHEILAVGREGLRNLICAHIDGGLSKFVVRPIASVHATSSGWRDDLAWLADAVLDLQS